MREVGKRINGPISARGTDERMTVATVIEPGELLEVEYHFANWLSETALQPIAWDMERTVERDHNVTVIWKQYGLIWIPDSDLPDGGKWQNVIRMQMRPNYPTEAGAAPIILVAVGAVLGSIATFLISRTGIGMLKEWRKIVELQTRNEVMAASVAKWALAGVLLFMGVKGIQAWKEG